MALPPPDLSTPEGKKAYRDELRRVGAVPLWLGISLILLGALLVYAQAHGIVGRPGEGSLIGFMALAGGWMFLAMAFLQRNRHHRRRMRGE